jgi:hypothetical protein
VREPRTRAKLPPGRGTGQTVFAYIPCPACLTLGKFVQLRKCNWSDHARFESRALCELMSGETDRPKKQTRNRRRIAVVLPQNDSRPRIYREIRIPTRRHCSDRSAPREVKNHCNSRLFRAWLVELPSRLRIRRLGGRIPPGLVFQTPVGMLKKPRNCRGFLVCFPPNVLVASVDGFIRRRQDTHPCFHSFQSFHRAPVSKGRRVSSGAGGDIRSLHSEYRWL